MLRYFLVLLLMIYWNFALAQEDKDLIQKAAYDSSLHYPINPELTIPIDVGPDLDNSFPKPGALFGTLIPEKYFSWKTKLYKKTGLKLGFSYQTMYAWTSEVAASGNEQDAWGGWFLFEAQWKAINRDKDWEGSLTAAIDTRFAIATELTPGELIFEAGVLTSIDATYIPWDFYPVLLFWEQHGKKGRIWFRVGQVAAPAVLDFFRYKDSRVSFTSPAITFPLHVMPQGAAGLGAQFKWHPIQDSELYVAGAIQDLNATAGKFDWSGLFDYGEIFAGLEIGKHWRRGKADFDHAHITVWYADERSSTPLPTKSGWGFKIHGTKQWNNIVGFANYSYNNSEGGGFSVFTNECSLLYWSSVFIMQ